MSDVKRDWKCEPDCGFCIQDHAYQAMHDLLVWSVSLGCVNLDHELGFIALGEY